MENYEMTFEELIQHFTNSNLEQFEEGAESYFQASDVKVDPILVLKKICKIYKVIRPALVILSRIPFIPPIVKKAVQTFMSLLDKVCP